MDEPTQPPAADLELTPLEQELVDAVEAGRDFNPELGASGSGSIRGEVIRAIYLGSAVVPVAPNGQKETRRPVALTAHGVRIVPRTRPGSGQEAAGGASPAAGLAIEGTVNLAGLAAPGGGPLPPLHVEGCLFRSALSLAGCHLGSLTLKRCRFAKLDAAHARFEGPVSIDCCRPPAAPPTDVERWLVEYELASRPDLSLAYVRPPERCPMPPADPGGSGFACTIDLGVATVQGDLAISNCFVRAAGVVDRDYMTPPIRDVEALTLRRARVRGRVWLHRNTVIGFVNCANIEARNAFWVLGGKYLASAERPTLDFQNARIGLLAFGAERAAADQQGVRTWPVVVIGHVSALGIDAEEVWIGEGCYFGHDRRGNDTYPTINFSKANIGRSFKVGAYHEHHLGDPSRPTGEAHVHGVICLFSANVGKNVELLGIRNDGIADALELDPSILKSLGVDPNQRRHTRLSAKALKVERRINIYEATFGEGRAGCTGCPCPAPAQAAAGSERRTADPAIAIGKSIVGTDVQLRASCCCTGAVDISGCTIGGVLQVESASIALPPEEAERYRLLGKIPILLDIGETVVEGHVSIGSKQAADPRQTPCGDGGASAQVSVAGALCLKSVRVAGDLLMGRVLFDLSGFGLPPRPRGVPLPEADRVALDMRGLTCGAGLQIVGMRWRLPPLDRHDDYVLAAPRYRFDGLLPCRERRLFVPVDTGASAIVDLRGVRCGLLSDGFGRGWGLIYRVRTRLAGMKMGAVEPSSQGGASPDTLRLRWLAHQYRRQEVSADVETRDDSVAKPIGRWERFFCATEEDFVPSAYEEFSSSYRRAGEDPTATRIIVERKNVEGLLRYQRLREKIWRARPMLQIAAAIAVLTVAALLTRIVRSADSEGMLIILAVALVAAGWPLVVGAFHILFRYGFRYGLSPDLGLLTLVVCVAIGWLGVHYAQHGTITPQTGDYYQDGRLRDEIALVLDVPPELRETPPAPAGKPGERTDVPAISAQPSPCDIDVHALLYALDVFIPLLDLDQERRCSIREIEDNQPDRYLIWRVMKALYEILGWLVTSLLLLTVTGVLRRDLER